jgi:hypothetical protein
MNEFAQINGSFNILRYDVITKNVFISGEQPLFDLVNSWAVQNTGLVAVDVNGKTLLPAPAPGLSGESFGVSGNYGEVYNRLYLTIQFAAGAGPAIQLVQKYYIIRTI